MKKDVNIYAYLHKSANLWKVLDKTYKYEKVDDYDSFLDIMSKSRHDNMYLYIVDIAKLKGKKLKYFKKELLSKKHLFVSAYGENIPIALKSKLHALELRGVIDDNSKHQEEILKHITVQANLHMQTLDNRFVRAFLDYHDLEDIEKRVNYLLSFISYKYSISAKDISDIHLVFLSLFIAFETDSIAKISKTLHTIIQSPYIDKLYTSYISAKDFKEKIIAILLIIFEDEKTKKYTKEIETQNIEKKLIKEIREIDRTNSTVIISTQDINYFWEQLECDILKKCKNIEKTEMLDDCIVSICNLLIYALARTEYILVHADIDFASAKIDVHVELFGATNAIFEEYIKSKISPKNILDIRQKEKNKIILSLKPKNLKDKEISSYKKPTIDKSIIESMHYEDDEKISAEEFLKEFEVEQSLLDDLSDFEDEINDKLYAQSTLTKESVISVANTLDGYNKILNRTFEFKDIAYSLESLSVVLKNLSLYSFDDEKKATLKSYIQGLVDDLSSWKKYIFIEPNTADIHYLDASLLENCATIENFISSDSVNENTEDDDLEFF